MLANKGLVINKLYQLYQHNCEFKLKINISDLSMI